MECLTTKCYYASNFQHTYMYMDVLIYCRQNASFRIRFTYHTHVTKSLLPGHPIHLFTLHVRYLKHLNIKTVEIKRADYC